MYMTGTKTLVSDELFFLEKIKKEKNSNVIIANNKVDLQRKKIPLEYSSNIMLLVETSALNNIGVEKLKEKLLSKVINQTQADNKESVIITNERHYSALMKTKKSMTSAIISLKNGKSEEFIAVDLRKAIDSIGEIIGLVTTEEILNNIFSKFCIGK